MELPDKFRFEMLQKMGQKVFEPFEISLEDAPPTSIRINRNKYKGILSSNKVAWCEFGQYLDERPIFTLDPAFHAGSYYVQEASSMFIWHILNQIGNGRKDLKILDLCAAPGGKSSLIATYLNQHGLLVANEIIKNRAYTLKYNLSKEGYANVIVSNNDPKYFKEIKDFFDIILVDAPCSGEGMFRKDPNAICEWSEENVLNCSSRQKRILADVIPALKADGHLIYSTCTYNDKENIDNVKWMHQQFDLDAIDIEINPNWNIEPIHQNGQTGYQFYPHRVKGEGFFVSVLQKNISSSLKSINEKPSSKTLSLLEKKMVASVSEWIQPKDFSYLTDKTGMIHAVNEKILPSALILSNYLRLIYCGVSVGTLNKTILIPDHSLALSLDTGNNVQRVDLKKNEALLYLKKELPAIDSELKSWVLITHEGLGIGWAKNLGNRINNYLPNEYKIRMSLD